MKVRNWVNELEQLKFQYGQGLEVIGNDSDGAGWMSMGTPRYSEDGPDGKPCIVVEVKAVD